MFKNQDLSLFNKGTYKEIDRIYISRVQNAMFKVMELQEEYGKYDNDSFLNEMKDSMVGMYLGYDFVNTDKHGFDAKRKNYEYDEWLEVKQVSFKSESWQATFNDTTIEKAEAFKDIKLNLAVGIWNKMMELMFIVYGKNYEIGEYLERMVIKCKEEQRRSTQTILVQSLIENYNFRIKPVNNSSKEVEELLKIRFKKYNWRDRIDKE
ncbi:hypothetical protein [Fusobacterium sp.]|jgi:hypothetical protein|uniref:hypothetical protein n=1 Tax=Fusobacterium sp. TaxID=68766 RepID=UPI002A8149DC|nr:hypothetical protein [Fusobacterium sp.]